MNDAIISVQHLSYTYQTGPHHKQALEDVTLEIRRGSCAALIGVTGSGKTTLIQHFNGLLHPAPGTVLVNGIDVGQKGTDLRRLRQHVGMLFQYPETQLFERTVYADVAFGLRMMRIGRREARKRVQAALDMVGLPHQEYARRSPFDLSGGQRRRVALAGVLAMTPAILVLDEPTVGLDAEGRDEFYTYLRRIQQASGTTIMLVSHDMAEVAALADTLFVLSQGRLVLQGTPRDVFTQGEQLRAWGLAAPPLSDLLRQLRERGLPVPSDILTLDEAFRWLRKASGVSR